MDESTLVDVGKLFAVLGLVAANGFFVASEFSLVSMRRSRVEELAAQGHGSARALQRATDNLDANLAATQLGITISSLALGWIGEPALAHLIEPMLAGLPGNMSQIGSHAIAVGIAFALITVFHIVLGELAPKSLALQRPERTAMFIVRPLAFFLLLFRPVIHVLNGLGNAVLRLCGLQPGHGEGNLHSTEELKLLVAESQEAGLVGTAQQEVVKRAFDMGGLRAPAIMTPRLDVFWIDANEPQDAMMRSVRQSRHEQVVVARGTLDNFIGVLRKQDLLNAHLDGQPIDPIAVLREPMVVHDGISVLQLFEAFKNRPVQMALVIDEYGVVQGIVTQTDLLEAIAGDIPNGDLPAVTRRDDGSFLVDGITPIDKAFEQLGLGPPDAKLEYHTLAGFALSRFGRIPVAGERFEWQHWRFEVVDMDGHRIDKLLVTPGEPPTTDAADGTAALPASAAPLAGQAAGPEVSALSVAPALPVAAAAILKERAASARPQAFTTERV